MVALIGALVTLSSKKRERKALEIYEAFDERGKLVTSLKESRDEHERKIGALEEERNQCQKDLKELRAEFEELQVMVGVPPKKRSSRQSPTTKASRSEQ